jgi:hypothetical protein
MDDGFKSLEKDSCRPIDDPFLSMIGFLVHPAANDNLTDAVFQDRSRHKLHILKTVSRRGYERH